VTFRIVRDHPRRASTGDAAQLGFASRIVLSQYMDYGGAIPSQVWKSLSSRRDLSGTTSWSQVRRATCADPGRLCQLL